MKAHIVTLPGDYIGPEIVAQAVKVLNAVAEKYGHTFCFDERRLGGASIDAFGVPLTDETLAAHPVDKIFVATEDEAILAALKAKYGGKLVYVECPRLTAVQGQSVAEGFAERGVDRKLNGLYYFASIAILARCDHLIAGKTMATQFIRTMRDTPFETEFYWDLGRYGVDDVGKRGM